METSRPGRGAARGYVLVKVPVEHKDLAKSMQALADFTLAAGRSAQGGRAVDYADTEKTIAERTAAIERAAHAGVLRAVDVDAPRIRVRGELYRRLGRETGTYFTMAGEVPIERTVYRPVGVRNGPILDPVKLRTGAYGRGWLPLTAQCMAHEVQRGPSREAEDAVRQTGRFPYSRASFERVAHMVGEHWLREHADIEDQITQEFDIPAKAASMSVCLDRVAVPMVLRRAPNGTNRAFSLHVPWQEIRRTTPRPVAWPRSPVAVGVGRASGPSEASLDRCRWRRGEGARPDSS